ncbi:MAG: DUF429 domain-containing protein [Candidatus Sedimenticola sp. 6PFRAG5]
MSDAPSSTRILGVDFTSAPRKAKPITVVTCSLQGDLLQFEQIEELVSFPAFEEWLQQPGPWVAGMDFPFSQPRKLIENLGWPTQWQTMISRVSELTIKEWELLLKNYRDARPAGDKQHLRRADAVADACSPMMMYGVPVGRMFFQGVPRLIQAGVAVPPLLDNGDKRIALEVYPALPARYLADGAPYKSDQKKKQTSEHRNARRKICYGLASSRMTERYGVMVDGVDWDLLVDDPTGDRLDALLCAVQASWAWRKRDQNYGIPLDADPLEGWIADPGNVQLFAAVVGTGR